MIPPPFEYQRAENTGAALSLLAEHGDDAQLLAGGHSLLPMMKLRLADPGILIDVGEIGGLSYARLDGDVLAIGALTRHCDVVASGTVQAEAPLLAHAASLVGDPHVRHRGTIGGSLAHADPAADLPMAVLALNATMVLSGQRGVRQVAADEFFAGYFETALHDDEMLTEIRVPRYTPPGHVAGWGYQKFVRRANDWAIVGVATVAGRVALANMGPRPLRASSTEEALQAGASVDEAAALAGDGTTPGTDLHADGPYRRHLATILTERALRAAQAS